MIGTDWRYLRERIRSDGDALTDGVVRQHDKRDIWSPIPDPSIRDHSVTYRMVATILGTVIRTIRAGAASAADGLDGSEWRDGYAAGWAAAATLAGLASADALREMIRPDD